MSLGSAAAIRVGFHVGARDLAAARTTSATVYKFSIGYAVVVSLLLVVFRYTLISIYTNDPAVIDLAATLLLFIAVYQLVDDSQAVTIGALRGYKDTRVPMLYSLTCLWGIGFGVGMTLGFVAEAGALGFWLGLLLGAVAIAILGLARVRNTFFSTQSEYATYRPLASEA